MTTFCRITEEMEPRPEKRPGLNHAAHRICELLAKEADNLRIEFHDDGLIIPTFDCGVNTPGSLEAGLRVARICLADRAHVGLSSWAYDPRLPAITVRSDEPLEACLGSQYAGWKIEGDGFFAMGSGPMRAAAAVEPLFQEYKLAESTDLAVGLLESREFPPPDVSEKIAHACDIIPRRLTLIVAPTSSLVGTVQVVARSVETALHKLHELKFDLRQVKSGYGMAPLPPAGGKDLAAMGRTNDAILYGGEVTLWVSSDDDMLHELVGKLPSSASSDFGAPFLDLFQRYERDFYKMDPLLFSPASITLVNLNSGKTHRAGSVLTDVVQRSFGT